MLQVKELSKDFGHVKALNNVSLNICPGEIRALLGSNGSGKSTLSKILGGLVFQNSGELVLDDRKISIKSPSDSRRYGISLAYQELSLIPQLTVQENISLGREKKRGRLGMIDSASIREETRLLIEKLRINAAPDTLVGMLDQSTKSLIEVAKALVWNPQILILDEVTACLHKDQVECLFDLLRELKDKGLAILMITHRLDEVFRICDTATILKNGQTVTGVAISEVDENDLVYYMTGKRPEAVQIRQKATESAIGARDVLLSVQNLRIGSSVKDISLDLHEGEIVGICGLQGQGQPEFLRALYGACPHDGGEISFRGGRVAFRSPRAALKSGIGFISGDRQSEGVFPDRPVVENVYASKTALGGLFRHVNRKQHANRAAEMIEQLKIVVGDLNHPASSLSGGNQQKLLFSRDLILDLRLILLDDPTKGVDINSRREIHQILRSFTNQGKSVLISSSDHEELLELCDRIVVFYEGRATAQFFVDENTEDQLVSAMLGVKSETEGSANQ